MERARVPRYLHLPMQILWFDMEDIAVILASYAPLFVNVNPGGMQWPSDLIGYDGLSCYGSPSYYAQKMFNTHLGDVVISCQGQDIPTQDFQLPAPKPKPGQPPSPAPAPIKLPTLFYVATKNSATGTIYLKVVNTASQSQTLQINLKGSDRVAPEGKLITLTSGTPADTNTLRDPVKVVPQETVASNLSISFSQTFPAYSINVLQIETK